VTANQSSTAEAPAAAAASDSDTGAATPGLPGATRLAPAVLIIAGLSFLVHMLVATNYGYFRDELYVMAMSHHPTLGYVVVPPLVPWVTLIPRSLTGNALWSIHVISALMCAGTIRLTGQMARLLGGAGWAQGLADRLGWEQQVALIAQVYHGLPPDEQRPACIAAQNYGEAGAVVQFGGQSKHYE
jgi:hypothetical protein